MYPSKEGTGNYQARPYVEEKAKKPTTQRNENEKILALLMDMMEFSAKISSRARDMKDYYLGEKPEEPNKKEEDFRHPGDGFFEKIVKISNSTHRNLVEIYEILERM